MNTQFTLRDELMEVRRSFEASTPIEAHAVLNQMIADLRSSGIVNGIPEGGKARDFILKDTHGEDISLYDELSRGPVVLTFYRGGWCPFCNAQMRAFQHILPDIHALGAQLLAVSPQNPDNSLSQKEKLELDFKVLSDTHGLVAAKYNVLFDVPEEVKTLFEGFGINLAEYNATQRWILPTPATFMIDESAVVRYAYVNPNYMERPDPQQLLEGLRQL